MFIVWWTHLGIMQPCNNRCNSIPIDVVVDAEEEVSYRTDGQIAFRSRADYLFFPRRALPISASSLRDHWGIGHGIVAVCS
jgi:hypothetical protein